MNNKTATTAVSPYKTAQDNYNSARVSLIILIFLTALNILLFILESDRMMLFSATIPYFAVITGLSSDNVIALVVCSCIAAVVLISYLICWIASKKNHVWLIVALVFFFIDTLGLVGLYLIMGEFVSGILDLVMHILIIVELVVGVVNGRKLKSLPAPADGEEIEKTEMEILYEAFKNDGEELPSLTSVSYIRMVDPEEKARILVEADFEGHKIQYRRVKTVNELVVDGRVYSEQKMVIEAEHSLWGNLDGHTLTVGMDNSSYNIIAIDGEIIAKKLRII